MTSIGPFRGHRPPGAPRLSLPTYSPCSRSYLAELLDIGHSFLLIAQGVWRDGAPRELRDEFFFEVIRFPAYREFAHRGLAGILTFRDVARSVEHDLQVPEDRASRTIEHVVGWVTNPAKERQVTDLSARPDSHADEVEQRSRSKLVVDEAAPVLSARRLPYRAIAAQLGSSRSTVFRAVKRARGGKLVRKHWTADEDRRLRLAMGAAEGPIGPTGLRRVSAVLRAQGGDGATTLDSDQTQLTGGDMFQVLST